MAPLPTYIATCWRDGTSWTVRIAQLGRTTRAARLRDVDAAARRLIGAVTGADPATVQVIVDLQVPDGIGRLLEAAAAARQEADLVSVAAVALRRQLARRLADHGYGVRDISVLLGVSYARARQLLADPPELAVIRQRVAGAPPAADARPHSSYQHEAFNYRDDEEFLAGTVPFISEAVRLGQPIMVALVKPRLQMVQAALTVDADAVRFVDMAELGANPARIIPAWLDFVREHDGVPVRGIGEPQWAGRRPDEVIECQLHEALLNVAIDPDVPLWLRCPYDVTALAPEVAGGALRTHPAIVEVGSYRGSVSYGGLDHVDSIFRSDLSPAPVTSTRLRFGAADLTAVRAEVTRCAYGAGLDLDRTRALTSAVAEIAGNSVRHGGGGGELQTWVQPEATVCQVTDQGTLADPLVGRRTPSTEDEANRGLWLANQMIDLMQIRSTPLGSTTRVFAWR